MNGETIFRYPYGSQEIHGDELEFSVRKSSFNFGRNIHSRTISQNARLLQRWGKKEEAVGKETMIRLTVKKSKSD